MNNVTNMSSNTIVTDGLHHANDFNLSVSTPQIRLVVFTKALDKLKEKYPDAQIYSCLGKWIIKVKCMKEMSAKWITFNLEKPIFKDGITFDDFEQINEPNKYLKYINYSKATETV